MELRITPGFNKLYRLALIGPGDRFEALSEHDVPADALAAKLLAQAAMEDAAQQLNRLLKERAQ